MRRAAAQFLVVLACLFLVPETWGQDGAEKQAPTGTTQTTGSPVVAEKDPPADSSSPVQPVAAAAQQAITRKFILEGKVKSLEGEAVAGAAVWVALIDSPAQRLAETKTDSTGDFRLQVDMGAVSATGPRVTVGAKHPECLEARVPLDWDSSSESVKLELLLRRSSESFQDPDLDAISAWLLPRIGKTKRCRNSADAACKAFETSLNLYRQRPTDWTTLARVLDAVQNSELPEARLLAALALMRMDAWRAAEKLLGTLAPEARGLPEILFLQGVLANFLRHAEEALQALGRMREELARSPLVQLELGRAAALADDWETALKRLHAAQHDRSLAPAARYLRARIWIAQGDLERASEEARALAKAGGRRSLPPTVQIFLADIQERLEERSIRGIESVMTQSVAELQEAVTDLARLDTATPPPSGGLEEFLRQVGTSVEDFFRDFSTIAATEVIRQSQLDKKGRTRMVRHEEFYYVFFARMREKPPFLEEFRGDGRGRQTSLGGLDLNYMATSGFASSLIVFHPLFQPGMGFRFLGWQRVAGQPACVVAFAQRPGVSTPLGLFRIRQSNRAASFYLQGIAWISADTCHVLRLRTDLLRPVEEVGLNRQSTVIDYRPYQFLTSSKTFHLPNRVSVSVEWGRKRLRNEHVFSRFRLFKVEIETAGSGEIDHVVAAGSPN